MQTKILIRTGLSVSAVSFFLCVATAVPSAQAGFQWVPPENADQVSTAVTPAPMASSPYIPTPQIIEGTAPVRPLPAPVLEPAPSSAPLVATTVTAPVVRAQESAPAPMPSVMDTLPAPTLSAPAAEADKPVLGFANNVPLSVALRQVLPKDYAFSVAQDISLGTLVSWKGGAPWRHVLKDMLIPAGLTIKEQGQMINVVSATEAQIAGNAPMPTLTPPSRVTDEAPKPLAEEKPFKPRPELGKPLSLTPASASEAPLPVRSVEDRRPSSSGFLTPPPSAAPIPLKASSSTSYAAPGRSDMYDAWTAEKGDTLRQVLQNWGRRANIELSWQSEYDYPLQASVALSGSFEESVRALLIGFENAQPQPIAQLHNNLTVGQSVLVVQTRGNNYNE